MALYLAVSLPASWNIACWHHDRGMRVADLVLGVAQIHEAQPDKFILLEGIDNDLFWSGIADVPFRAMEIPHVYLIPGSESAIDAPPGLATKYTLPEALSLQALQQGRAVVYHVDRGALRNITARYRATAEALWKPGTPSFINLGDPAFAELLGPGWDNSSGGFRLLRHTATVRIAGPATPADRLYVDLFGGPARNLHVRADGLDLTSGLSLRLPASLIGKPEIELTLINGGSEPLRFGFLQVRR